VDAAEVRGGASVELRCALESGGASESCDQSRSRGLSASGSGGRKRCPTSTPAEEWLSKAVVAGGK